MGRRPAPILPRSASPLPVTSGDIFCNLLFQQPLGTLLSLPMRMLRPVAAAKIVTVEKVAPNSLTALDSGSSLET